METNDVKKKADKAFAFCEQLCDKFVEDAIDQGLGTEELFGAITLFFMDTAVTIRLSSDGVTDYQSQYAQNKREEFGKKLNILLNEFLSENNEYINETIQEDSRAKSSKQGYDQQRPHESVHKRL